MKLNRLSNKKDWRAEDHAVTIRVQDTVELSARVSVLVWRRRSQEHAISGCESLLLIRYGGGLEAQMLVMATFIECLPMAKLRRTCKLNRQRHPQILGSAVVQPLGCHAMGTKRKVLVEQQG